jgi:hypothetical protein
MAPLIHQRVQQIIAGVNAVNESDTAILKAVKAGTLKIESNQNAIELANNDLTFKRIEQNEKQTHALEIGLEKHKNDLEIIKRENEISKVIMLADFEYRNEQLDTKVPLLQLQADRQNLIDRSTHALQFGESSQPQLVPQKEYGIASPVKKLFRWIFS